MRNNAQAVSADLEISVPRGATLEAHGRIGDFDVNDVAGNIELWHFWASPIRRTAIRRVIAICQQKLPKIKVMDTVKPVGEIWTANQAAVAARSASDMPQCPCATSRRGPTLGRDSLPWRFELGTVSRQCRRRV